MNILFIHKSLHPVGGIETLILRLLKKAKYEGDNISLALYSQSKDCKLLWDAREYASYVKAYRGSFGSLPIFPLKIHDKFDVIYCFGWRSLIIGLLYRQTRNPKAKICCGVYHSREFCWDMSLKTFGQKLVLDVFKRLPKRNIIFMSTLCLEEHQSVLRIDLSEASVVPLALEGRGKRSVFRGVVPFRIVSVGRLVDFKTYNSYMLDVMVELKKKGDFNWEYHIYGDGPLRSILQEKVVKLGLEDCVFLHGSIEYNDLHLVFEQAWVFVGMGTALLEAALYGVPSIIAIESEPEPVTYGFAHEVEGINCGEVDTSLSVTLIVDKILSLTKLTQKEYQVLEKKSMESMRVYDIDFTYKAMMKVFRDAKNDNFKLLLKDRFFDILSGVYWKLAARVGFKSPLKNRYLKK